MNRQVKRYAIISDNWDYVESPIGGFIDCDDFAALEAECDALREALEHCLDVMKDPWKHGEGCISRAIYMADAALAASTGQEVE